MVTNIDPIVDSNPIPRMQILEAPAYMPQVTTVARNRNVVTPLGPEAQPIGNVEVSMTEEQEIEQFEAFKKYKVKKKRQAEKVKQKHIPRRIGIVCPYICMIPVIPKVKW
ncbi:unnamed protein product [Lactuca virosa]|uniref:Uncharacterized protein n=1 Tax=Lactuca virosa TaxID=75947 RepID=A0AAU9M2U5_9ASTR|nr:unnamed protein product [Lactuca virosa]